MLYLIRSYKIIHINKDIILIKRLRSVLLLRSLFFIIIVTTFSVYSLIVNFKKPIFENFIEKLLELLSDWPSQWLTVIAPVIVLVLFIPSLIKAITGEIYEFNNITKKVFKNNKELTIFDKINNILLKFTKGEGNPEIRKKTGLPVPPADMFLILNTSEHIKIIHSEKYEYVKKIGNEISKLFKIQVNDLIKDKI